MEQKLTFKDLGIISTWANIARFIDRSIRTAKRYHYEYHMPVRRWPGNVPCIIPEEVIAWVVEYNRLRKLARKRHRNATKTAHRQWDFFEDERSESKDGILETLG